MKRLISFLCCVLFLPVIASSAFTEEETERLVIAIVNYESEAENFPIEEAFFKEHPNATIEYRLYTSE